MHSVGIYTVILHEDIKKFSIFQCYRDWNM